jgi:hypothetical protein
MSLKKTMKDAVDVVTGGAARVTIGWKGEVRTSVPIAVVVTATSTGSELEVGGVFVDVRGTVASPVGLARDPRQGIGVPSIGATFGGSSPGDEVFQLADGFVLAPDETRTFTGEIVLPERFGEIGDWQIRGRLEAFGNDPDSGFVDFVTR